MIQTKIQMPKYLIIIGLVILAVSGTWSCRALYADGPFWLYQMLLNDGLYIFDIHRAYAQYAVEWPVYLAILSGVRDLTILMHLHSFGVIAIPITFWCVALKIQYKSIIFWLLTLACSVTYLRSGFFAVGEFNTAYGLVGLSIAIILKKENTNLQKIILLFSAFVLMNSYESMLFLGAILFIASIIRLFLEKNSDKSTKLVLISAACMNLYSIFIGLRSTFFYRKENLQVTINYGALYEVHVLYLLAMIVLASMLLLSNLSRRLKVSVTLFSVLISVSYMLYVWRWDSTGISYGFYSYAYRSLGAFMLAGILCIACIVFFYTESTEKYKMIDCDVSLLSYIVSAVFYVQAGILFYHTIEFHRWLITFEQTANTVQGLVPIDKTKMGAGYSPVGGYNWPWSNSTLSVLLRGNAESIITNASDFQGWETFDPKTIEKYPLKQFSKMRSYSP